jgi:hypothetical protein
MRIYITVGGKLKTGTKPNKHNAYGAGVYNLKCRGCKKTDAGL